MNWIELKAKTEGEKGEILIATLGAYNFDTFIEEDGYIKGYVVKDLFHKEEVEQVLDSLDLSGLVEFSEMEMQNWNEDWEKNFQPLWVDEDIYIRATFHESVQAKTELVIEPKMSFGTGHHQTTRLVIKNLKWLGLVGKSILDCGTGTGILAIYAAKAGAKLPVYAYDIDEWCIENAKENFEKNAISEFHLSLGTITSLRFENKFDVVIANINRNVLLEEMEGYSLNLKASGYLVLSGFYTEDAPTLLKSCEAFGLLPIQTLSEDNWVSILLQKA